MISVRDKQIAMLEMLLDLHPSEDGTASLTPYVAWFNPMCSVSWGSSGYHRVFFM